MGFENDSGEFIASGMHIIFVECPGTGAKTLKAAIMQNKFEYSVSRYK